MTHRLNPSRNFAMITAILASQFITGTALAEDRTLELDVKHQVCLERIAVDSELAYEEAMIWRDEGGGRRAKHC